MPIIKSAKKAARQTAKRTKHNKQIKTAIKAFNATPTGKTLAKVQSELDKAVKKGLIKKNTAARRKAALAKIAKAAKVVEKEAKKVEKAATKAASGNTKKTTTAKKSPAKTAAKSTTAKKPAAKKTSLGSKAASK